MTTVLSVERLALSRGGRLVVSDVTFSVESGEALLVTGPNGAGKSTLLRALAGLLRPASGAIRLTGALIDPDDPPGLHAHYVGHADALKSALTAHENLTFWAAALGGRGGDPLSALQRVGLPHVADIPAGWLSAGQRRRVSLGRLFVAARPLWILDEPATALDKASQARLADAMAEHRASGGLIVAATHAPLGLDDAHELRLGDAS